MLCENCGKREANVRYSENINGVKKEMHLCEECSKKLGITDSMDFRMPTLDFSNFFGSFLEDFTSTPEFMPLFTQVKDTKCESCGSTFNDIINSGRFGCPNCYDVFGDKMDPILKKLQGANRHVGRLGKIHENAINTDQNSNENKEVSKEQDKLTKLENDLKQAIKEERYEDAAKIRDEIKKLSK